MTHQNKETNPFWSGFTFGAVVGTGLMYIMGTKKGRDGLKRFLSSTENFEEGIQEILTYLRDNNIVNEEETPRDDSPMNAINTVIDVVSTLTQKKTSKSSDTK